MCPRHWWNKKERFTLYSPVDIRNSFLWWWYQPLLKCISVGTALDGREYGMVGLWSFAQLDLYCVLFKIRHNIIYNNIKLGNKFCYVGNLFFFFFLFYKILVCISSKSGTLVRYWNLIFVFINIQVKINLFHNILLFLTFKSW